MELPNTRAIVGTPIADSWVRSRKPWPPGTKISLWWGRSAPPDSTRSMTGSRFWRAISSARRFFLTVAVVLVPPRTVGSLAMITHSTPSTTPTPVNSPAPTGKSVPHAASGDSSSSGLSASTSSSTRSRHNSLPRWRWRATYFSPPPWLTRASWRSCSAICSSSWARFAWYASLRSSTWSASTGMAGHHTWLVTIPCRLGIAQRSPASSEPTHPTSNWTPWARGSEVE